MGAGVGRPEINSTSAPEGAKRDRGAGASPDTDARDWGQAHQPSVLTVRGPGSQESGVESPEPEGMQPRVLPEVPSKLPVTSRRKWAEHRPDACAAPAN